ncbi:MAG: toll/interleukin-1 receptor domain-containing protein [Firmicutes bacterium]|nr:toll/interleukin-1 receptor domain-containing protein [Bacillota bacterium]
MTILEKKTFSGENKVFISHAHADNEFAIPFAEMLNKLGVNAVFCSSIEGQGVKNGDKIEESVRNEIVQDKALLYILSSNFMISNYCLEELGAGWILHDSRVQGKRLFLLGLPDVNINSIIGFINGGDKFANTNSDSLLALIDEMEAELGISKKEKAEKIEIIDAFLQAVKPFLCEAKKNVDNGFKPLIGKFVELNDIDWEKPKQ